MKINYSMRLNSLGSAATQISYSWPAKMFASTLASTGHATGLLTGKSWWTRGIPPKMMEEIWISIFAWIIPWNQQIEQYPIVSTTVFTILSIFIQYVHKTDSFCWLYSPYPDSICKFINPKTSLSNLAGQVERLEAADFVYSFVRGCQGVFFEPKTSQCSPGPKCDFRWQQCLRSPACGGREFPPRCSTHSRDVTAKHGKLSHLRKNPGLVNKRNHIQSDHCGNMFSSEISLSKESPLSLAWTWVWEQVAKALEKRQEVKHASHSEHG